MDDTPSLVSDLVPVSLDTATKSIVWKHFERITVHDLKKARCVYCKRLLGAEPKNGTSHLHAHIKSCLKKKNKDIRQSVLDLNNNVRVTTQAFDQNRSREKLVSMIIIHEYPLSIVDHVGFRNYSFSLQPLFKCPSRNTIRSDVFKVYDNEKCKIMDVFSKLKSRVAITTDMWTASNQKRGFMAITGHYIDSEWTLRSNLLRFMYVPHPHTTSVLTSTLVDFLLDWNIDGKLSTITLDNYSTNDLMMVLVKDKLKPEKLMNKGSFLHMRCCAHILNLIVRVGLDVIKEEIDSIRSSIAYWTATAKRVEKFEECAKQLKIPITKKLSLDCPTRWNSTYLMLETAMPYGDCFDRLSIREPLYTNVPTSQDWRFAREICARLKVFYAITELFSGDKYPTSNLYFSKVCEIKVALTSWSLCSDPIITKMAGMMLEKFKKYWDVIHEVMGVAAVLDPRYKLNSLEFYFSKVYGRGSIVQIDNIKKLFSCLIDEYNEMKRCGETFDSEVPDCSPGDIESEFQMFISNKRAKVAVEETDFDRYLKEAPVAPSPSFDLLLWWKVNGWKYPSLMSIAKDVLAIPVSSVASESAFSAGGRLISPHRSRLHPKTVEALMCAQSWLSTIEEDGQAPFVSDGYCTVLEDYTEDMLTFQCQMVNLNCSLWLLCSYLTADFGGFVLYLELILEGMW